MSTRLNPYLSFTGNARAAMEFYRDVFGGELHASTFGEFGQAGTPHADQLMHSTLETPSGYTLMAADTPPGMDAPSSPGAAISLSGDDADELQGYWDKLSADGQVAVALEQQMWGDVFGMCTDRFGVTWMVNIAKSAG